MSCGRLVTGQGAALCMGWTCSWSRARGHAAQNCWRLTSRQTSQASHGWRPGSLQTPLHAFLPACQCLPASGHLQSARRLLTRWTILIEGHACLYNLLPHCLACQITCTRGDSTGVSWVQVRSLCEANGNASFNRQSLTFASHSAPKRVLLYRAWIVTSTRAISQA